jgi:hypothetical protein
MRIKTLATVCAALLLAGAGAAAAETAHVPATLPTVTVVRPPDPATPADSQARLRRFADGRAAFPRTAGEQPMLGGDPEALAIKRAELGRARAAQSARTRALHGLGVDATPKVP